MPRAETASTFQIVLGKGKEVVGCFSTSEVASATPAKHDNLNATITITEISPQAETGNPSRTMRSKENNLAGCFSTFEVGSTSTTTTKQHNPQATIIGFTGQNCWDRATSLPLDVKIEFSTKLLY